MAQGEFTKEEAQATIEAVQEIAEGMSKKKKIEYIGHLNDIFLFLEATKRVAPEEAERSESPRRKTNEIPG